MVLLDDRELLAHLAHVNSKVPDLALRLVNDELPVDEQRAFAQRLADVADALLAHANRRDQTILVHQAHLPVVARPSAVAGRQSVLRLHGDEHGADSDDAEPSDSDPHDDDADRSRAHRGASPGRRGRLKATRVAVAMSDPSGTAC